MKYKSYLKYKNSGIEWLGKIPEGWRTERLKTVINDHKNGYWGNDRCGDKNDIYCIRVADFNYNNLNISTDNLTIRNIQENWRKKLMLRKGNLLIEKSGGGEKQLVGRVVYFNKNIKAICSNFVERLRISTENDSGFLKYIFAWLYLIRINIRSIKQTTGIQNLDIHSYLNELIVVPSKKEQIKIVNYLDEKTGKINVLIEKNKKQIELLKERRQVIISQAITKGLNPKTKMKDSKIDWLGEIPKKWELMRLRYIVNIYNGFGFPHELQGNTDGDYPFFKVGDINKKVVEIKNSNNYVNNEVILQKGWKIIPERGIIMAKIGEALKMNHRKINTIECLIDNNMMAISPNSNNIFDKYLYYLFKVINMIWFVNPGAVPSVNMQQFKDFYVPVLSLKEQRDIVNYLDHIIIYIDNLIKKIELQNQKLKEFSQSLISNVVTGKIKIS